MTAGTALVHPLVSGPSNVFIAAFCFCKVDISGGRGGLCGVELLPGSPPSPRRQAQVSTVHFTCRTLTPARGPTHRQAQLGASGHGAPTRVRKVRFQAGWKAYLRGEETPATLHPSWTGTPRSPGLRVLVAHRCANLFPLIPNVLINSYRKASALGRKPAQVTRGFSRCLSWEV